MSKLRITVFDNNGNDVTDKNEWYIDIDGNLYFMTNDIDMPLQDADDFTYDVEVR